MPTYEEIIKKCKKDWACPDLMTSVNKVSGEKIPFSSPSINYATYGGIPKVGLTHFYGFEGSGKSTTAMDLCKNAYDMFVDDYNKQVQELTEKVANGEKAYKSVLADLQDQGPKKILYVDVEHTFDRKWAATLGLTEVIEVMQTPNIAGEDVLNAISDVIETGEMGLVILDSVPSLIPRTELIKKIGDRTVAALAGMMTEFTRRINPILFRGKCALLLINQQRENMENQYVDRVPGGRAIRFYSSLELSFRRGTPLDFLGNEIPQKSENPAGYKILVTVKKQKSAPFDRKLGEYYLMAQSGLRVDLEFANLALNKYNLIQKNKAWFTICDPETKLPLEVDGDIVKVNGMGKVYEYLQVNQDYYQRLCDFIVHDINDHGLAISAESEPDED